MTFALLFNADKHDSAVSSRFPTQLEWVPCPRVRGHALTWIQSESLRSN